MTNTHQPAQAMDGLSKTFCITGPDGSSVPLVRISAEFSRVVDGNLLEEVQGILRDAEERIWESLSGNRGPVAEPSAPGRRGADA